MFTLEPSRVPSLPIAAQLAKAWLEDRGHRLSTPQCLELVGLVQAQHSVTAPLAESLQQLAQASASEEGPDPREMVVVVGRLRLVAEFISGENSHYVLDVCSVDESNNWPSDNSFSLPLLVLSSDTNRPLLHRFLVAVGLRLGETLNPAELLTQTHAQALATLVSRWDTAIECFPEDALLEFKSSAAS